MRVVVAGPSAFSSEGVAAAHNRWHTIHMPGTNTAAAPRWVGCPLCEEKHLHVPDFDSDELCEGCFDSDDPGLELIAYVESARRNDPYAPYAGTMADAGWRAGVIAEYERGQR